MQNSMLLITSTWNDHRTFRLIPTSTQSIYNEAIYDRAAKVLALVGKDKKESFHMLPKLNEVGDVSVVKIGKRSNGKDYAEERRAMETYYEYYIEEQEEIENFIKLFAVNADTFDYQQFLVDVEAPTKTTATISV